MLTHMESGYVHVLVCLFDLQFKVPVNIYVHVRTLPPFYEPFNEY